MHTVTCSCDNVLPITPEIAGRTIPCPKCRQPIQVPGAAAPSAVLPDTPPPAPKPAPKPAPIAEAPKRKPVRRPASTATRHAPRGNNTGLILTVAAAGLLAVIAIVVVVATSGGGDQTQEPTASDPKLKTFSDEDHEPDKQPEKKKDDPVEASDDPIMVKKDYRRKLDLYIWRINLSAVAASYLDQKVEYVSSNKEKGDSRGRAADLRYNMNELERKMNGMLAGLRARGEEPYVPDYIKWQDKVTHFDNQKLSDLGDDEAMRILGNFIKLLKPGSRARVIVNRRGEAIEFDIRFDERPKELMSIIQVADIIPGKAVAKDDPVEEKDPVQEDPVEEKKGPVSSVSEIADAFDTLVTADMRAVQSNRQNAQSIFESARSGVATAAAIFLSKSDKDWNLEGDPALVELQRYFEQHAKNGGKGFSDDQHAKAVEFLAGAVKRATDKKTKAGTLVLVLFAEGHLGDLAAKHGAGSAKVKAAAQAFGYAVSADGKVLGARPNIVTYDLAQCGNDVAKGARIAKTAGGGSFPARYAAMYYKVRNAVETGKGLSSVYSLVTKEAKRAPGRAKAHLNAIARAILEMGKCTDCTKGSNECQPCGGKGKRDVTCPDCKGQGKIPYPKSENMYKWCQPCATKGVLKNMQCPDCKGRRTIRCTKCTMKGWVKEQSAGSISSIWSESGCGTCSGRGIRMKHIARLCEDCIGLGKTLQPSSDPSATLK